MVTNNQLFNQLKSAAKLCTWAYLILALAYGCSSPPLSTPNPTATPSDSKSLSPSPTPHAQPHNTNTSPIPNPHGHNMMTVPHTISAHKKSSMTGKILETQENRLILQADTGMKFIFQIDKATASKYHNLLQTGSHVRISYILGKKNMRVEKIEVAKDTTNTGPTP